MRICTCCQVKPCLAKKIPLEQFGNFQEEHENYCIDCLPFENAPIDAHKQPPDSDDYLYVLDQGSWYIAYVKTYGYNDIYKGRLYEVLYCSESGKGRTGQLMLKKRLWYSLNSDDIYRVEIWTNNKSKKWWRKQWKKVNTE